MIDSISTKQNFFKAISGEDAVSESRKKKLEKLREASQQFEAIFIGHMLKTMRETIPDGGLFDRKLANDFYESMFDQEISIQLAKRQNRGFADILFRQLSGKLDTGTPLKEIIDGVNELKSNGRKLDSIHQLKSLEPIVQRSAKEFDLDPKLIHAVIMQESAGNPNAVSSKGAKGLMQLIDSTAKMMGVNNPFDPEENIRGGAKYLKQLLNQFDNKLELALAAYNAGPENVKNYGGIPQFKETQNYVEKVLQNYSSMKSSKPKEIT